MLWVKLVGGWGLVVACSHGENATETVSKHEKQKKRLLYCLLVGCRPRSLVGTRINYSTDTVQTLFY